MAGTYYTDSFDRILCHRIDLFVFIGKDPCYGVFLTIPVTILSDQTREGKKVPPGFIT
jgi:hypothetical protein